ncbi:MAG: hypothetical protein ACO3D2_00475 [Holophagaceae bacterium]
MRRPLQHWFSLCLSMGLAMGTLPLSAQWDLRLEIPSANSRNLPDTLLTGSTALQKGQFDLGKGYIVTGSKALFDLGVVSLDGSLEYSEFKATGTVTQVQRILASQIKQQGLGVGLNAMVWAPFIGVAGEFGVIQRFQSYEVILDNVSKSNTLGRTWMRVGARYRIPFIPLDAYVTASWQQPLNASKPVEVSSTQSLVDLLNTQGTGQEFNRLWTFGVGIRY